MDLVVLVAELSQESDKSLKELDKELSHRGYSSEEIEQALFWMSSQWRPLSSLEAAESTRAASRVLSPWEQMGIDTDGYRYLLRLQNLGILSADHFERIMSRILPFDGGKLQLGDIKALAGMVLFHLNPDDPDDGLLQVFDDDVQLT